MAADDAVRMGGLTIYTVGHSTRAWEDFVALLQRHGIGRIADVRAFPGSRRFPHFGREPMAAALEEIGISYLHMPALGGRRRAPPGAPPTAWRNAAFAAYAHHMRTPEFRASLDELIRIASDRPTSIMCSEAVPWRCHRSLVADALMARRVDVRHILDSGARPAALTPFARVVEDEVRYDVQEMPE